MSLFAQAKEAKAIKSKAPKSKKKSTTWMVGSGESEAKVAKAVSELKSLNAEKKAIDAKMKVHNTVVKTHARSEFFETFAANGVFPETPMKVQNDEGEAVTFVVQDRSTQYEAKAEQLGALEQILGEDGARDMIGEETRFSFQRDAMMNPDVMAILEQHLEAAIAQLTEAGLIEGFEDVLDVNTRTAFKPGTLQRLALICGKDAVKMRQVMDAMGSSAPNYVLA
jgi:hypothetical protein